MSIIKALAPYISFVLFGVLLMSCMEVIDQRSSGSTQGRWITTKTEAEEWIDSLLVCIKTGDSHNERDLGSGFLVSKEGHILTAWHVVQSVSKIVVELAHRNTSFEAESLEYIPDKDIALLKISPSPGDIPDIPPLTFVCPINRRLEKMRVIGLFRCTSKIDRSGVRCKRITVANDTTIFLDLGKLDKGSSGSPIMIEDLGYIVGFVKSGFAQRIINTETGELDTIWVGPHRLVITDFFIDLLRRYQVPIKTISVFRLVAKIPPETPPPPPEELTPEELKGMLKIVEFVIENTMKDLDAIFQRKLFIDIVFESSLELASLKKVLMSYEGRLSEGRKKAIYLYLHGLLVKASHAGGAKESHRYFDLAVHEDPSFAEPHYQIAIYLIKHTDRKGEAFDHLLAAKECDPENPEVLRSLAVYYLETEQFDSAEVYLKEAERRLPGDPRLVHYWGVFFDPYWRNRMNPKADPEKSKSYFERCKHLAPNYMRPINNQAWVEIKQLETDSLLSRVEIEEIEKSLGVNLGHLARFVQWGIVDPRVINTLSKGYAVLGDHPTACGYLKLSEEQLEGFDLSPQYLRELKEENKKIKEDCGCPE